MASRSAEPLGAARPAPGPGATGPGATGPGATGPGATGPGTTGPDGAADRAEADRRATPDPTGAAVFALSTVDAVATGLEPDPPVAEMIAAIAPAAGPASPDGQARRRSRTSPDRVQRSFYLSRDLVDRARAAVAATMGCPGEAYNVSQLAGRGLEAEVLRLEETYNGGAPFPPVTHVRSGPSPEGVERIRSGVTARRRPT